MKFDYYKKREVIVSHDEIITHIERLAAQINHDYKDKELIIVPLLTSCIVFLVELLTRLTINVEISLLKISTYTEYGEAKRNVKQISSDFK
jgi:hypoxanthine phosphoribosyltransferase